MTSVAFASEQNELGHYPTLLESNSIGGPRLIVKNTFLDVDDVNCDLRTYRRWKTCPEGNYCESINDVLAEEATESKQKQNEVKIPSPTISPSGNSNLAHSVSEHTVHMPIATPIEMRSEHPTSYIWSVDARKLRGSDRSIVSKPFELALAGSGVATFKLMLCAGQGGQSFKQSRGHGTIQLKCEQELRRSIDLEAVTNSVIRFSIGTSVESAALAGEPVSARTVRHNFLQSAACVSPDWDFRSVVNERAQTFTLLVRIVPAQ